MNPSVRVTGLEINPERVLPPRDGVNFELGGFELRGYRPQLVRAFNVLRQYDVDQVPRPGSQLPPVLRPVASSWRAPAMSWGGAAPGSCWMRTAEDSDVGVGSLRCGNPLTASGASAQGPYSPQCAGRAIYELLKAADEAWAHTAGWAPHGPRIRWREARKLMQAQGIALHPIRRRIRDCVLTVDWNVVAPAV